MSVKDLLNYNICHSMFFKSRHTCGSQGHQTTSINLPNFKGSMAEI